MQNNKKVRKLLEKEFHLAWVNLEGDPDAGKSNRHATKDKAIPLMRGTGRSNVQMLVLTPDGRILHAMSGYIPPKDLEWELEQALKTWASVRDAEEQAVNVVKARQKKIQAASRARTKQPKGSWIDRITATDRAFVVDHPLLPLGAFQTRMLTGGPGAHFGYQSDDAHDGTGLQPLPSGRVTPMTERLLERRKDLPGRPKVANAGLPKTRDLRK